MRRVSAILMCGLVTVSPVPAKAFGPVATAWSQESSASPVATAGPAVRVRAYDPARGVGGMSRAMPVEDGPTRTIKLHPDKHSQITPARDYSLATGSLPDQASADFSHSLGPDPSLGAAVYDTAPASAAGPESGPRGKEIAYAGPEPAGTIIVNTPGRFLLLVQEGGRARRYRVGVGRPGFQWAGVHSVTRMVEWPEWIPPDEMRERHPELPERMAGGPNNPLGARALYLGSTLYRIHGTNEPWSIGGRVSSGCIRMRNEDVIDLFSRVSTGTRVVVI